MLTKAQLAQIRALTTLRMSVRRYGVFLAAVENRQTVRERYWERQRLLQPIPPEVKKRLKTGQ